MTNYLDRKEVQRNRNSHSISESKHFKDNSKKICKISLIKLKNKKIKRLSIKEIPTDL